jgi:hypothetical protein
MLYCKYMSNCLYTDYIQRHTTTEALLNWIEIRRVWWQEKENLTAALNNFSKGACLVNRTVVEN